MRRWASGIGGASFAVLLRGACATSMVFARSSAPPAGSTEHHDAPRSSWRCRVAILRRLLERLPQPPLLHFLTSATPAALHEEAAPIRGRMKKGSACRPRWPVLPIQRRRGPRDGALPEGAHGQTAWRSRRAARTRSPRTGTAPRDSMGREERAAPGGLCYTFVNAEPEANDFSSTTRAGSAP